MRNLLVIITILLFTLIIPSVTFAQGMMNWSGSPSGTVDSSQTAKEEAEGKAIWDKLQAKQLDCKNLTDDNFDVLGEYFMGQSIGDTQRHAAMNQMMKSMMGEQGEAQMHIVMGKRLSSCDPNAAIPSQGYGFWPMMGNSWGNMMGWGFGIGWIFMIIFWVLIILGVIALVR